jgi:hypothetical protein
MKYIIRATTKILSDPARTGKYREEAKKNYTLLALRKGVVTMASSDDSSSTGSTYNQKSSSSSSSSDESDRESDSEEEESGDVEVMEKVSDDEKTKTDSPDHRELKPAAMPVGQPKNSPLADIFKENDHDLVYLPDSKAEGKADKLNPYPKNPSEGPVEGKTTLNEPAVIAQARSLLYTRFAKEGEENNLRDAFGKCEGTTYLP